MKSPNDPVKSLADIFTTFKHGQKGKGKGGVEGRVPERIYGVEALGGKEILQP